ncbi:MAG: IS481 family transposase, partial [Dehalococcoidia bacterium]|nr:IS481 family transposase [Dehalococcoidia bacterium]
MLRKQGFNTSSSTVGRVLTRLKARGVLKEPPRNHISAKRKTHNRPYAIRKPKDYEVKAPGDLVQIDTLDVRPLPGVVLKHFTARDVISRWDVVEVYTRATAMTAMRFLDKLEDESPFPIRAIQVDGGAEFRAVFEEECRKRGIKLFVLPPHSPELNGYVER